jgi:hypothetical protein
MLFIFVLAFFRTNSFSSSIIDTQQYKTKLYESDAKYLFYKSAGVIKILRNIVVIVSVLSISVIGIRYMIGSVEEKSQYKEIMFPLVVGCILIIATPLIIDMLISIFD